MCFPYKWIRTIQCFKTFKLQFNRSTDVPNRGVHASILSHTTSYKNRKDAECSYLLRQRDRPLEGNEKVKLTTAKARDFVNRPSYLKLGEYCICCGSILSLL